MRISGILVEDPFMIEGEQLDGAIATLPKGKELKVLLLDGNHLANVIYGLYKFQELLEHDIRQVSLRGEIYCAHNLQS